MDEKEQSQAFLATLQENSIIVRNTYISYLLVAGYICFTVVGTTHEQLLSPELPFPLPVIKVTLSVKAFYAVAPIFLFLFHLYFLLHVAQYAGQLATTNSCTYNLNPPFINRPQGTC